MEKLRLQKEYALPECETYRMLVALDGDVWVSGLRVPQGRAAFLPAAAKALRLLAGNAEVLMIKPGLSCMEKGAC